MRQIVPYVSLATQWSEEREILLPVIESIMASGVFIGGDPVTKFEKNIASYCGSKYAVALNSGTDALVCALVAAGVRRGDEVITPANSFVASTASIVHIGAKPVFVDVDDDQLISASSIEKCITSKTKAIMPVHLTGRMAKMDGIMQLSRKYGIPVIEDCAQSVGSKYKGVMSGTYGKVGCFSTHPLKNLNACGDGGFIVTDDENIHHAILGMRSHGMIDRNTVERFGYVSRMDTLQAAILNSRLDRLHNVVELRQRNARIYASILNKKYVYFPEDSSDYFNTFHTFVIQVKFRDKLIKYLSENGVSTAIHYPIPIHLQPAAKTLGYSLGSLPATENQSEMILSLPINQYVSEAQIVYVANLLNKFFEEKHE